MLLTKTNQLNLLKPTGVNIFGTLTFSFFVMLMTVGFIQLLVNHTVSDARSAFLIGSAFQSVLAFIFPAWLTAVLCTPDPGEYLGFSSSRNLMQYLWVAVIYCASIPFINFTIDLNASLRLPDSLEAVYTQLKLWEDTAADTTQKILGVTSVSGLVSGLLIVGCLTGFAEEMFFRGGLLRAFLKTGVNRHVGIWVTALIFSAIHFQFFGFIPRLLIGAFLGYLYVYTGSIWVASFAHALNNSLAVIVAWLVARGIDVSVIESIGMRAEDLPIVCLSVFVSVAALIWFINLKKLRDGKK